MQLSVGLTNFLLSLKVNDFTLNVKNGRINKIPIEEEMRYSDTIGLWRWGEENLNSDNKRFSFFNVHLLSRYPVYPL